MSVSLSEVIAAGGYDLSTYEDALWLLSKQSEFDELIELCEVIVDKESDISEEEYQEFINWMSQ